MRVAGENVGNVSEYNKDTQSFSAQFKKSGAIYEVKGAPIEVQRELIESSSPGTYWWRNIRGRYEITRIA